MKSNKDGISNLLKRRNKQDLQIASNSNDSAEGIKNEISCHTPLNKDLNPLNSFNQVSPLIIKNMSKKGGMRSLSNSKLLGVEPVTSLPVLNKKGSTRNILTSEEMIKNKKQEENSRSIKFLKLKNDIASTLINLRKVTLVPIILLIQYKGNLLYFYKGRTLFLHSIR